MGTSIGCEMTNGQPNNWHILCHFPQSTLPRRTHIADAPPFAPIALCHATPVGRVGPRYESGLAPFDAITGEPNICVVPSIAMLFALDFIDRVREHDEVQLAILILHEQRDG